MTTKTYGIKFGIELGDLYTLKILVDSYPDKTHLKGIYNLMKKNMLIDKETKRIYREQIAMNVRKIVEDEKTNGLLSSNLTRFTDDQILKWITCYIDENPEILE